ncbi:pilus assembly protein TadG-related protein [Pseudomonas sp. CBSPBW29]|uniref:pilus assembly protein TadG-related protein n=1 Tax=Pseudomonas TaxID=286 RepID=UPI0021ACCE7D|nr:MULTISPECIES: pilus assembly protein TadG-related protein [unclassified Pseudomonas]WEL44026.1 pilus assembly protein TadG-related protein [Pseudomonas sp. CBSPBW29]WEL65098.1 pilus assembly protein TadG-related protein [Pseudomonas sp. CBSPGW29]WEL68568.1 pilus assembly protein TadG-related protein [Pseudomonas sp. CBSPCGW29]WEL75585.1 pilus assembly protein TadG-related protein [Pseudomonas sp. CBSPAW29]WEL80176.1 pilus assembly protein TadG-related protein [Pseudomonas sp. CBSPCAW29]WEL
MVCHGLGPARQRGAIGLMGAMTLGIALLFMLLVVDSGRLYLEKRKLQRVADTAALEVVTRGGACVSPNTNAAQFAIQSATRNDFPIDDNRTLATACGTLVSGADFIRTFSPNPSKADAIQVIATHRVVTSIANGLLMLFSPGPFEPSIRLQAVAVAAVPAPPVATLTIRSTLLTVDSTKSAALNALIGGLLGGKLQLNAVGWEGLINTNISLLSYLDALAIRLNVSAGNYDELLKTDASVGDLIQAAIDVIKIGGDAVKVVINNLEAIKLIAPGTKILHLGDLLTIQNGTDKSALDVKLQLFNLIQGFVQLSNKYNAVAVELPVDVLGLLNITVKTKVIEPAQISAIGNPKLIATQPIYVRTAQVRTLISVNLPVVGVLNDVVGGVTGLLGLLLGSSLDAKIGTQLDVALEAASGSSEVTGFRCNGPADKSLSVVGTTSAVRLMVGQIDPKNLFSSTAPLSVDEFPLLDLGIQTCSKGACDPRQPYAVGGISLRVDSSVAKTTRNHTYGSPPEVNQPPAYFSFSSSNVVGSLSNTLSGIQLINHPPTQGGLLGLVLNVVVGLVTGVLNLLTSIISGVLSPLLDPLVNNLLAGLGVDLAKVEIGANLSCSPGGRAILVI